LAGLVVAMDDRIPARVWVAIVTSFLLNLCCWLEMVARLGAH
jgi:hypothetical protein